MIREVLNITTATPMHGVVILPLLLVQVERSLVEKGLNKEYAGMMGVPEFVQASVAFAFTHDSPLFVNKTVSLAGV